MSTALQNLSQAFASLVEHTAPTLVAIRGTRSAATGIHWQTGLVVTSYETLHPQDTLSIKRASSASEAVEVELLGADPTTDVAILALPEGLEMPVAEVEPDLSLLIGHLVMAVGYRARRDRTGADGSTASPQLSASLGTISRIGGAWRSLSGGQIDQFIEVDINLHHGEAGSPLINAAGHVVGFNTFGPRRSVLTIPAANVNRVIQQLQARGKVTRGYLGLGMQSVQLPEVVRQQFNLSTQSGIIVVSLDPDAAANQAGVLLGDVIVAVDSTPVSNLRQIQAFLDPQRVGQPLVLTLVRGGQQQDITVTVGER